MRVPFIQLEYAKKHHIFFINIATLMQKLNEL